MLKLKLKNSRLCCRYFTYNKNLGLRLFFYTDNSGISEPGLVYDQFNCHGERLKKQRQRVQVI